MNAELATIRSVNYGPEDHGIMTCWVTLDFDTGGTQGFGGLNLTENGDDFVTHLCAAFGVSHVEQLVGKRCVALRSFTHNHAPIEGLESELGHRFTLTAWRRRHYNGVKDPMEQEIEQLDRQEKSLEQQIDEVRQRRASVARRYTDVDTLPRFPWGEEKSDGKVP